MRTTIFFLFLAFSAMAQDPFQKVIYSDTELELFQSLKANDSTLANWYFGYDKSYFGTTKLDCTSNDDGQMFANTSFNNILPAKGLVGAQGHYYTLLNYTNGTGTNYQTALLRHDLLGIIDWQKELSSSSTNLITSTDMATINDSLIGVISHTNTGTNTIVHIMNVDGNLQHSFEIEAVELKLIERNNDSTFWILGSYMDQTSNQVLTIGLFDIAGNKLKEFSNPELGCVAAVVHNNVLKVVLEDVPNYSQIYLELDSSGVIGQPTFYLYNFYPICFVDLIPFNQYVAQVQGEVFHGGTVSFYHSGKYILEDGVKITGFVALDSVNALVYSLGPEYGVKSFPNYPDKHIGVTLIDSSLTNFQSCSIHSDYEQTGNVVSIILDSTNLLVPVASASVSNPTFSMIPYAVYVDDNCIDHYGSVYENSYPSLSLFPNPSNDLVTIVQPNTPIVRIEVCALNGQMMKNLRSDLAINSFDISSLANGVYVLKCWSKSGQVYVNRIVKD